MTVSLSSPKRTKGDRKKDDGSDRQPHFPQENQWHFPFHLAASTFVSGTVKYLLFSGTLILEVALREAWDGFVWMQPAVGSVVPTAVLEVSWKGDLFLEQKDKSPLRNRYQKHTCILTDAIQATSRVSPFILPLRNSRASTSFHVRLESSKQQIQRPQ